MNGPNSVGIVETQYFTFAQDKPLTLDSGEVLGPITLAYETYGRLNEDHSNAILICHALSGHAHAAGFNAPDEPDPGWWDDCIGPGKAFDTTKFFVICSNVIGGCKGSTGPMSIDPQTRDVVQNVYIRRVERVDGELRNVEFATIADVKDPWKELHPDAP